MAATLMSLVHPSVTTKYSLSFKARELKLCTETPHTNPERIFLKFHLMAEIWVIFQTSQCNAKPALQENNDRCHR